jgi:hypothetical protein
MDVDEIIKFSKERASRILKETEAIREDLRKGRPNSSDESTTEGALKAMEVLVSSLPEDFLTKTAQ